MLPEWVCVLMERGALVRQLTSLDAQFLAVESEATFAHVGGLAICDPSTAPEGDLGAQHMRQLLAERLHLIPPFRWRLREVPFGLDHPYWLDDPDLDVDAHVHASIVPSPGGDEEVAATVERIFARPLDRSRPLWEMHVLSGLAGGRVALLTKVHHSVVDGVSGNAIFAVLTDPSPTSGDIAMSERPIGADRMPAELEMLGRGLVGLARQPLRALSAVRTTLPNLTDVPGASTIPGIRTLAHGLAGMGHAHGVDGDPGTRELTTARPPRTSFNRPISPHRSFAFGSVSLDAVKAIKNALGVKVNDVVVTLCASAVREWLLERAELPEEPLVAMVPVSTRTPAELGRYGNKISTMTIPIPTNEANGARRLTRTHELLQSAKQRHERLPRDLLNDACTFIPPPLAARAARATLNILGRTRPAVNLVISNVPGPRAPLYIGGAQLEAHYPVSAIVDGVGLNMTVMSYRDHIDFGIIADRTQIDHAWSLMGGVERALDDLEAAVAPR